MKLSLEALKERAGATASNELLETITGGNENACHNSKPAPTAPTMTPLTGNPLIDPFIGLGNLIKLIIN